MSEVFLYLARDVLDFSLLVVELAENKATIGHLVIVFGMLVYVGNCLSISKKQTSNIVVGQLEFATAIHRSVLCIKHATKSLAPESIRTLSYPLCTLSPLSCHSFELCSFCKQ